ncbi:putative R-directed D polymerase from mobile element jockey-like [Daphnia sinensis]|uniref:R-directed D polymerase from mobile element jockey-like n=1 Tax=Daphnia sinensis TaxID=1820382 RepID=A0AAD5L9R1_9CRUS|nr:putative R-directed D polymerase from mobile element jockey-like [Daphnia sinensis]
MWAFVTNMAGKGSDSFADGRAIILNDTLFLENFNNIHPKNILTNRIFEATISDTINSQEVERAIPKSRSNATGLDLIQNKMLLNLSSANKAHFLHLFNTLLSDKFVPAQWKTAVVIPLVKQGKPTEDLNSYRPVSLTSCLGKTFERILSNRLHWYLETKCIIIVTQAGFRRGCSTTDHIAQLDSGIKLSFNMKQCTVAALDTGTDDLQDGKDWDVRALPRLDPGIPVREEYVRQNKKQYVPDQACGKWSTSKGSTQPNPIQHHAFPRTLETKILLYADDVTLYTQERPPHPVPIHFQIPGSVVRLQADLEASHQLRGQPLQSTEKPIRNNSPNKTRSDSQDTSHAI